MKQWREHLRVVVTGSFSPQVRIVEVEQDGDFALLISWRLGTDQTRPAKRSKTIRIAIEADAMDEYSAAPLEARQLADGRLARHLQEQLLRFDPEHRAPLGQAAPLVRWSIGIVALFG